MRLDSIKIRLSIHAARHGISTTATARKHLPDASSLAVAQFGGSVFHWMCIFHWMVAQLLLSHSAVLSQHSFSLVESVEALPSVGFTLTRGNA
jgi:hypothetical protein